MKKNCILSIISVILLTFIDQIVKYIINAKMTVGSSIKLIDGFFSITYVQNQGAAWGSFYGKRIFLLILTIAILIGAIIIYIRMLKQNNFKALRICILILISGAIGNIIDRIIHGYVIDMFEFKFISFPVFNVADIYITCSIIIILILVLFKYKDEDFNTLFKS
ncbi:MAG: signal peptidase II [Coprococcus sp.]